MKKWIVCGIVAAAMVVAGFASFALAEENTQKPEQKPPFAISEEQKEILKKKIKVDLDEMLEAGDITQEQYDFLSKTIENCGMQPKGKMHKNADMPQMTEEKKAEMLAKIKEDLDSKLSEGKITQEEYDEKIAAIENGEFKNFGRGFGRGFDKGEPNGNTDAAVQDGEYEHPQKNAQWKNRPQNQSRRVGGFGGPGRWEK